MSILLRADYRELRRYGSGADPCAIDLSDNTNLWGATPSATAVLAAAASGALRSYPDPYSDSLKSAIAQYAGVEPSYVTTGAGSDDVLDCTFRALGGPGARVAHIAPTFVMAPVFARTNSLEPVAVNLTESYDANASALLATNARIIYLCSPNNPTSGLLSRDAIELIVDRAPGFVIVDEAYMEFAGTSVVDLLERSPRLVISRTFSKAFGLAGLRIGYALAAPDIIAEIEKARGPYKVNALAAAAAKAALDEDLDCVRERAKAAIEARQSLRVELAARGLESAQSNANFLFVPTAQAGAISRAMRSRGVAVRAFFNLPPINEALSASNGSALRITVGPPDVMTTALGVLDQALEEVRG